jgi:hypothetical protein
MTRTAPPDEKAPEGATTSAALHTGTSNIRELLTRNLRQSGIYVAFVAIIAFFAILTDGVSLSPINITNIILQYSYILVLAIGMVIVIIAGHIDLSVGSVVAVTGAISAVLVIQMGMPWWVGILAAVAAGVVIGAWHGFWVAYVGIPAFIVTLAGMLLFRGLTQQVLGNISLSPFPAEYQLVATGFINGLLGGPGYDIFTLLIGVIAVAGYAVSGFRTRLARITYQQRLRRRHPALGVRTAGLRHRWEPVGRGPLRRQGPRRQLLDLRQHGRPVRRGGDHLLLPLQRGPAERRQHVRARRDRGGVHRRCGRDRRRRHRRRGRGRRPDHGNHEQRNAAHGHRAADPVGGEGHSAATGGGVRHLQQATGRLLALRLS